MIPLARQSPAENNMQHVEKNHCMLVCAKHQAKLQLGGMPPSQLDTPLAHHESNKAAVPAASPLLLISWPHDLHTANRPEAPKLTGQVCLVNLQPVTTQGKMHTVFQRLAGPMATAEWPLYHRYHLKTWHRTVACRSSSAPWLWKQTGQPENEVVICTWM